MACSFLKTQPFSTFYKAIKTWLKIYSTLKIEVPYKIQGIIVLLEAFKNFHPFKPLWKIRTFNPSRYSHSRRRHRWRPPIRISSKPCSFRIADLGNNWTREEGILTSTRRMCSHRDQAWLKTYSIRGTSRDDVSLYKPFNYTPFIILSLSLL